MYRLDQFEINYTNKRTSEPQYRQSSPRRTSQNSGGIGVGSMFSPENLQYLWNGEGKTKVTVND